MIDRLRGRRACSTRVARSVGIESLRRTKRSRIRRVGSAMLVSIPVCRAGRSAGMLVWS
jgi:hypothetical protein